MLGDPTYGVCRAVRSSLAKKELDRANRAIAAIDRQALHAAELSFVHPATEKRMRFVAPPPADMAAVLDLLGFGGRGSGD